jgi:arginyl-tRNA synthetase
LSYQQAKPNFIMSWLFDFMKWFNSRYSNTEKIINLSEDQKKAKLYMLYAIKKYLDIVFTTFKLPIDVERI